MGEFHEVRWFHKGPFAMTMFLVLAAGGVAGLLLDIGAVARAGTVAAAVAGVLLIARARVETAVGRGHVTIRVVPFRSRSFAVADIDHAEVVIADHLVPVFGGWNAREDWIDAVVRDVEGTDRSTGNKAVRFSLADGTTVQVGSWKPHRFLQAVGQATTAD